MLEAPTPVIDPGVDTGAIAETAAEVHREEARGIELMLALSATALIVAGWLLPWFVEPTNNGIGFSPQDAILAFTGVGTILVYVVGVAMVALIAGVVYDITCLVRHRGRPFAWARARGAIAIAGAIATLLIWYLIGIQREEPLFGDISTSALTDNAVWMMLTGMLFAAFTYLRRDRLIVPLVAVSGTVLAATAFFVPWFLHPGNRAQRIPSVDRSALDALGSFSAIDILIVLAAAAVVAGGAFAVVDVVDLARDRQAAFRRTQLRGGIAAAGAGAVLLFYLIVGTGHAAPFGNGLSTGTSGIYCALAGLLIVAAVMFFGERLRVNTGVAFAIAIFAFGGCFPLIFNQSSSFVFWGADSAAIYLLLALGLNVVVGFAGLLDLGYAAFFAIGAYTTASLASSTHGIHLSFWLIVPIGAAVAAIFGVLLGAPTLRLRGDYLAIVTLGFGEIVPNAANNNLFGKTGGPNGLSGVDSPSLGRDFGLAGTYPRPYFYALLVVIGLIIVALRNVERSRLGRAWIAIREDEVAASATGINTVTTKLLAFSIGASVSGFAGAFFGAMLGTVTPENFGFQVSVTALSTVVLGGIGNISGVVVGAILISFVIFWVLPHLQEWGGTLGETTGVTTFATIDYTKYSFMLYGVILIGIMLLRPGGLLPSRARKVELQSGTESEPLVAIRGAG